MKKLSFTILAVLLHSIAWSHSDHNLDFQSVASTLGARVDGEKCFYSIKSLTDKDSNRYSKDPMDFIKKDTYGADWSCLMLKRHMDRDSLKECRPSPEEAFNVEVDSKVTVSGKIKYMGLIPQPYHYEVSKEEDGKILISVRIHFGGELGQDAESMKATREKLAYASMVWSKNSPDQKFKFHFEAVEDASSAHFKVKLNSKTMGTKYNSLWGAGDTKETVTHEVGHMLGLDDEYSVVRSLVWEVKNKVDTRQCNLRGIMCSNTDGYLMTIYPYYYYLIMRRVACL